MTQEHERDPRQQHAERPVLSAEACGASPAAQAWQPLIEPGMYVLGENGDIIGQVKEVRAADFLIDRSGGLGLASDTPIYLPFERVHAMAGDRITLDISSSQVDEEGTVPASIDF